MKTLQTALIAALVIAGAVMYWIQHQASEKLRANIATLTDQNTSLKADAENLANQLAQATNSQAIGKEQLSELLKLRGEVGQLRRQAGELAKVKQQAQAAPPQVVTSQDPGTILTPEDQFKLQEIHTVNAMKQLGLAMRVYAGDNNDQYATNFDQLKNELGGATNFPGNISLDAFEFVNAGLVNDTMPDMIIFRERQPRRLSPDSNWQRIYGLADGSVHAVYSSSDDTFDEFEKPRLVPPPQN
jgi:ATP phosphoribosyltransferase regulatory subunit HisZ